MPWKESSVTDERMPFVIRLNDGETMASLCREFGISRKTGYKIFERYQQCGLEGLSDRTRRPFRYANQVGAIKYKKLTTATNGDQVATCCLGRVIFIIKSPSKSKLQRFS